MDINNINQLKDLYSAATKTESEEAKKLLEDYAVDITGKLIRIHESLTSIRDAYREDEKKAQEAGDENAAKTNKTAADFIESLLK